MALSLLPETIVRQGEHWTLAVNRNQDLLGKTMLVLRRPCTAVVDLTEDEWLDLRRELAEVVPAVSRLFAADQCNLSFLMNQDAQVHLHVIPRYAGPRTWHGDEFVDPHWGSAPGHEQRILAPARLAVLAAEIAAIL